MSRREDILRRENYRLKKVQRTREIRYRVSIAFVVVTMLVIAFSINLFMIKSKASSENSDVKYKYYTSVMIESGETLWDVAKDFSTEEFASLENYIKEVKSINNLKSDKIYAGQEIIVPYYSTEYKWPLYMGDW